MDRIQQTVIVWQKMSKHYKGCKNQKKHQGSSWCDYPIHDLNAIIITRMVIILQCIKLMSN